MISVFNIIHDVDVTALSRLSNHGIEHWRYYLISYIVVEPIKMSASLVNSIQSFSVFDFFLFTLSSTVCKVFLFTLSSTVCKVFLN